MCNVTNTIKFCTCVNEDLKKEKDIYIWTLYRYLGSRESKFVGKIMLPVDDLNNGITVENIISKLNKENVFDFDYTAVDKDSLHICFNAEKFNHYKYFTLIFKKGVWQEGSNSFTSALEEVIAKGKIELESVTTPN